MSKRILKSAKATSLDHAIELTEEFAAQKRMPSKVMCELMGVEYKTYRRWMIDGTMPLNKLFQLERLAGCHFISEYLCVFHGNKIVIDIPRGTKAKVKDIAQLQSELASVITFLADFYHEKSSADATILALTAAISDLAFHRENVVKNENSELGFGEENE